MFRFRDEHLKNGQVTDSMEVTAVGVVLVSSRFLLSHAYLKDSAVCILGCSLAKRARSHSRGEWSDADAIGTAAQSALGQARQQLKDLTEVEPHHISGSDVGQALSNVDPTQRQDALQSLSHLQGTTGLSHLCVLGQLPHHGSRRH